MRTSKVLYQFAFKLDDPAFGRVPRATARSRRRRTGSTSRRATQRQRRYTLEGELVLFLLILFLAGCARVGPNYTRPETAVLPKWLEADDRPLSNEPADYRTWWRVFNDPVLDRLIDTAYRQNLSLRVAGVRVLEARAQLGIAVGGLYPQTQQGIGSLQYNRLSEHSVLASLGSIRRIRSA